MVSAAGSRRDNAAALAVDKQDTEAADLGAGRGKGDDQPSASHR